MDLKLSGGLIPEKRLKRKDFIYEKSFQDEIALGASIVDLVHLGRFEKVKNSPITNPPLYQGSDNACVVVSATACNQYNSWFNDSHDVKLDWKWAWNQVPKYSGGTKLSEVLSFFKKEGVPEVGKLNAENYKIDGYFKLTDLSNKGVYTALQKSPVLIGFWTDEAGLTSERFAHEVLLLDINQQKTKWQIMNWWEDGTQDFDEIPVGTSLINAAVLRDMPDLIEKQEMRLTLLQWLIKYLNL